MDKSIFKLYSTNLYSVHADSLVCSIANKNIDGIDNIFAVIKPQNISLLSMDNSSLHVGYSMNIGREFLERKGIIEGEEQTEFLSFFRGMIYNYPAFELIVEFEKDHSIINCDVIRVKGGCKRELPYYGYVPFAVEFIEFAPNGEKHIIKQISDPADYETFRIKLAPKVGQILSRLFAGVCFLDAIDLDDYIDGVRHSYQGRGGYHWKEVKGDVNSDSQISSLEFSINLNSHIAKLYDRRNLYYREYQVISHASFDPGPDDCYESTDKFIWAAFSFNESFLLSFLASIETVSSFSFEKQNYENVMCIRFNKEMTKNRFEELTGIHLFELTQHTSG